MKPSPLSPEECLKRLSKLPNWRIENGQLRRTAKFPSYKEGVSFVNDVAALAEEADHHPDILLAWGRVELTLVTHSASGITELDFDLAHQIDGGEPNIEKS